MRQLSINLRRSAEKARLTAFGGTGHSLSTKGIVEVRFTTVVAKAVYNRSWFWQDSQVRQDQGANAEWTAAQAMVERKAGRGLLPNAGTISVNETLDLRLALGQAGAWGAWRGPIH